MWRERRGGWRGGKGETEEGEVSEDRWEEYIFDIRIRQDVHHLYGLVFEPFSIFQISL